MMTKYSPLLLLISLLAFLGADLRAQNRIPSSKAFLNAQPDARTASLAGGGSALDADAYAIFNNPSRVLFSEDLVSIGFSYSPWRPQLSPDMKLFSAAGYYRLAERHSLLAGWRYLSGLKAPFQGPEEGVYTPFHYSLDLGYGALLLEDWSVSVVGTYAHSRIAYGHLSRDLCLSLATSYQRALSEDLLWSTALSVRNIGLKNLDNASDREMLPTAFIWGNALSLIPLAQHQLTATLDLTAYKRPAGNSSRLHPVAALGAEYGFRDLLFLRAAYRLPFKTQTEGDYAYISCGLGLKYKFLRLDGAYLFSGKDAPMQGAWWLTTSVAF